MSFLNKTQEVNLMFMTVAKNVVFFLIILAVIGCSSPKHAADVKMVAPVHEPPPLRVGVTSDYPPIIFKQNDKFVGVEAELAHLLAKELNRPLKFVELKWKDQIPALMNGNIDIIMSGMSITRARRVRIDFTNPYLQSGQMVAMRAEDEQKYNSIDSIMGDYLAVGVIKGTTGDVFVQRKLPKARAVPVKETQNAVLALKGRRIDLFIHDAPSIVWIVSENEADIAGLWEFLDEEFLAWGVKKGDDEFLSDINTIIDKWKEDGTLDKVINKWLPFFLF
jgi:polar amino acid transport system substrate-binding protein